VGARDKLVVVTNAAMTSTENRLTEGSKKRKNAGDKRVNWDGKDGKDNRKTDNGPLCQFLQDIIETSHKLPNKGQLTQSAMQTL